MRQAIKKVNRDSGLSVAAAAGSIAAAQGIGFPLFSTYLGLTLCYQSKGGYKAKEIVGEGGGQ